MFRQRRSEVAFLVVAAFLLVAGLLALPAGDARAEEGLQSIVVQLDGLPPSAVAADQARRAGRAFDRAAHERAVFGAQRAFLSQLRRLGIEFSVTESPMQVADGTIRRPNQFAFLLNAVGLRVPADQVERIRTLPGVRHVELDEPLRLHLDNSVRYVRASDGPGNKAIFTQGGGAAVRFDGKGQVVAVLDTGIEHTHPAFDSQVSDDNFEMRTGDARPVRLAGAPYVEGVNHPKVVYFLNLTAATNEDDVGHGTHAAADAAGLKVAGPGLDRIPGNDDDQIIEGVAPGALLMNYKVCETIFTCVGSTNLATALEDALSPTDPAGNPKPVATVINMSFGSSVGNPNSSTSVASNNAALAGAVVISSAGNSGPGENTAGAPAVARRVIGVAAARDPGALTNEVDVLARDDVRYSNLDGSSTGAQDDTAAVVASEDRLIKANILAGAPDVSFPLGQHYVYTGLADTPDQVPVEVFGRIALASRGSTVDAGVSGSGAFANKAAEAAARGAVALLVFNNVDGELEAATAVAAAIPVYGLSKANGEYLLAQLGFRDPGFDRNDSSTWGTISEFPVRINLPDPSTFEPSTTGFSSRGPADNFAYLKPDVTAPGENIYAATIAAGGVSTGGGTMSDPSRYISVSGTSFSGPHVAGAAALVRQALLEDKGELPIDDAALRAGACASLSQAMTCGSTQAGQNQVISQSVVRAALTNTATNLRQIDGETPVDDADDTTLIHEIGAGLIHVVEAVDARAILGTNDQNGPGGPDDAADADFLPTHSFGQNVVIDTGIPGQTHSITVTLQNLSGTSAAGDYTLHLVDGGGLKGDVTRPIAGTTGFSLALSEPSVTLGAGVGDRATFDVSVTVDGRPAPDGLAFAGADVTGRLATEFLWYVVAQGANGELLRMPFYFRAVDRQREAPFQNPIQDDAEPDQVGGIDHDGSYKLSWTFDDSNLGEDQLCGFQIEEATTLVPIFEDTGDEPLVAGGNSNWSGDPEWISSVHPSTGTLGYQALYHDEGNASLTLDPGVAIPAGVSAQLVFDSFEDIEDDFDFGFVEVSADGSGFVKVAEFTGFFSGQRQIDLTRFAGQTVQVRFRLESDLLISTPLFLGWFIDNIEIQVGDFQPIGTTEPSELEFDVTGRTTGTYFYRVAGLFSEDCSVGFPAVGQYSNVRSITVDTGEPTVDPSSIFSATPNPADVGEQVTFDGSASHDNDAVGCDPTSDANACIVTYFWSFGDGATATTSTPTTTHSYAAAGTYRATLTVTDNDGETDSSEAFIEVSDGPAPGGRKTTGGGFIDSGEGKANFGFNAQADLVGATDGHLTYHDKAAGVKVLSESITSLVITGNTATFSGTCSVNKVSGYTFTVEVEDHGEPGDGDRFSIRVSSGYEADAPLGGGNIQIH